MVNSTTTKPDSKDKNSKADAKARGRAEQATVVSSLQAVLESDEHLLGFARGKIAGGWRGKLNVGPEAFFAPEINVGLTERRVVLQHYQPLTGKPSEIMPHTFPLTDIVGLSFSDIETFGAERACRLVLRLNNEQHFRIRLKGDANFESAQAMAEVFASLKQSRRNSPSPTQSVCPRCSNVLDAPTKFCPYCGNDLRESLPVTQEVETAAASQESEGEPQALPVANTTSGEHSISSAENQTVSTDDSVNEAVATPTEAEHSPIASEQEQSLEEREQRVSEGEH